MCTEVNTYSVGVARQPTNDSSNRIQSVYCEYRMYANWADNRFEIHRTWRAQSGNFYYRYYSYSQNIYSRVYAYPAGSVLYSIPECKVSVYVLSSVENGYTVLPKP